MNLNQIMFYGFPKTCCATFSRFHYYWIYRFKQSISIDFHSFLDVEIICFEQNCYFWKKKLFWTRRLHLFFNFKLFLIIFWSPSFVMLFLINPLQTYQFFHQYFTKKTDGKGLQFLSWSGQCIIQYKSINESKIIQH